MIPEMEKVDINEFEIFTSQEMNTSTNVFLLTAATTLVGLGAATIQGNLWTGVIEFVLGIAAFLVYELTPSSPTK